MAPLFVYGSLRFQEVLLALLDRVPASAPAQASGWRVAALRDHVYPGLVAADGTATGLLLVDLTDAEWRTLDAFENDLYGLHRLPLDDDRSGWAYVCQDEAEVLAQDWDAAAFVNGELGIYVQRCREWREWHESKTAQR
jgi:gamma-glutamylcyclotransferase (GGCT)/AIG2-like uncharacterized protein YtfP